MFHPPAPHNSRACQQPPPSLLSLSFTLPLSLSFTLPLSQLGRAAAIVALHFKPAPDRPAEEAAVALTAAGRRVGMHVVRTLAPCPPTDS